MDNRALSEEARSARAFAPSHITGFFQIFDEQSASRRGSTGAGVNTDIGATSSVSFAPGRESELLITINGERSDAPVSKRVVRSFSDALQGRIEIVHEIGYPIGYGMGMSGAGAFSLALALNDVAKHRFSYEECMELAVTAEIESGTGLGDVVAQQFGGIMIGLRPYPSRRVENIPTRGEKVVCAFFEPLDTGKIIRDAEWKRRINLAGERAMERLLVERSLERFMELSREFTFETGLASERVREVLCAVPETSMAMLGQTAFAVTNEPERLEKKLREFTDRVVVSGLAESGARIL